MNVDDGTCTKHPLNLCCLRCYRLFNNSQNAIPCKWNVHTILIMNFIKIPWQNGYDDSGFRLGSAKRVTVWERPRNLNCILNTCTLLFEMKHSSTCTCTRDVRTCACACAKPLSACTHAQCAYMNQWVTFCLWTREPFRLHDVNA